MFNDAKPFDWLMLAVELLVLALIAYEVVTGVRHKRRISRRISSIFVLMQRGQALEDSAPSQTADEAITAKWIENVSAWDAETNKTLANFSPQAAASYGCPERARAFCRFEIAPL
jgi:hypothetical protein